MKEIFNVMPHGIKLVSTTIDMRETYKEIGLKWINSERICPILIAEQDLADDIDYILLQKEGPEPALITRKGLGPEEVADICYGVRQRYNGFTTPMPEGELAEFFKKQAAINVAEIYMCASMIAEALKMRCPPIIFHVKSNGSKGTCYNAEGVLGKTAYIEINDKPKFSSLDYAETLAHEMRHCWQHETDPVKFFSEYKYFTEYAPEDIEQYYMQPAERDANAYALRYIQILHKKQFSANTPSARANYWIEKDAKKLDSSLFPQYLSM